MLRENISFLIPFISFYQPFFLISFLSFYQLFANITEKSVWVPSAHPSTCDSVMFLLPFCQLVCTVCILMLSLPILQCVCTQICLGNKIGGILSVWGYSRKWGGGKCLDPPLLQSTHPNTFEAPLFLPSPTPLICRIFFPLTL